MLSNLTGADFFNPPSGSNGESIIIISTLDEGTVAVAQAGVSIQSFSQLIMSGLGLLHLGRLVP